MKKKRRELHRFAEAPVNPRTLHNQMMRAEEEYDDLNQRGGINPSKQNV
jgi:hypothetical protein